MNLQAACIGLHVPIAPFKLINPKASYSPSNSPGLLAHHHTCIFLALSLQAHPL